MILLKKVYSLLFISIIILFQSCIIVVGETWISAQSAILFDPQTNEVLFEKNSNQQMSMASTTKILTALICVEYLIENPDELVTITEEMVLVEGSSMGLASGDEILLSDLIFGMLFPSGNDAANSVAIHLGGDLPSFAKIMNSRAKEIGMISSSFVTPSGLDDELHFTTAYDMALLMATALKNEIFMTFFTMSEKTITYNDGEKVITLHNENKLLSLYENAIGGKTGYTKKSGRCLVTVSSLYDYELICVTLNSSDDWNDHITLFNLGFTGLNPTVFGEEFYQIADVNGSFFTIQIFESTRATRYGEEIVRKIFLPRFLYSDSYKRGETIGSVVYYKDGVAFETQKIIY